MFIVIDVFSEYNSDTILLSRRVVINHGDDKRPTTEENAYVTVEGNVVQIRTQTDDKFIRQYVNVPVLVRYHVDVVVTP